MDRTINNTIHYFRILSSKSTFRASLYCIINSTTVNTSLELSYFRIAITVRTTLRHCLTLRREGAIRRGLVFTHLRVSFFPRVLEQFQTSVYSCRIFNCIVTGSTDDSKANTDQGPDVDEEQSKPNEADDAEEGNLEDEGGDDEEGTGQQEQQGTQDTEETGELDLPDDLQLDEEGDEGNNGTLYQLRFCCVVVF